MPSMRDGSEGQPLRAADVRKFLRETVAALLQVGADAVREDVPLREQGLDSLRTLQIAEALSHWLGRPIPQELLWQHGTVGVLAQRLLAAPGIAETHETAQGARSVHEPIAIVGMGCRVPGGVGDPAASGKLPAEGQMGRATA